MSGCVEGVWSGEDQREERRVYIGIEVHASIVCNELVRILSSGSVILLTKVTADIVVDRVTSRISMAITHTVDMRSCNCLSI